MNQKPLESSPRSRLSQASSNNLNVSPRSIPRPPPGVVIRGIGNFARPIGPRLPAPDAPSSPVARPPPLLAINQTVGQITRPQNVNIIAIDSKKQNSVQFQSEEIIETSSEPKAIDESNLPSKDNEIKSIEPSKVPIVTIRRNITASRNIRPINDDEVVEQPTRRPRQAIRTAPQSPANHKSLLRFENRPSADTSSDIQNLSLEEGGSEYSTSSHKIITEDSSVIILCDDVEYSTVAKVDDGDSLEPSRAHLVEEVGKYTSALSSMTSDVLPLERTSEVIEDNTHVSDESADLFTSKRDVQSADRTFADSISTNQPSIRFEEVATVLNRPEPPPTRPPGIPVDQPAAPSEIPKNTSVAISKVTVRPPPADEPSDRTVTVAKPTPPTEEPPTKKGKRIFKQEEERVRRRDREFPEFEELSSDEEEAKDFQARAVQQVKPPTQDLDKLDEMTKQHFNKYKNLFASTSRSHSPQSIASKTKDQEIVEEAKISVSESINQLQFEPFQEAAVDKETVEKSSESSRDIPQELSRKVRFDSITIDEPYKLESIVETDDQDMQYESLKSPQEESNPLLSQLDNYQEETDITEDLRLAALLPRGKLTINCIEVIGMNYESRMSNGTSYDVSVKFRLGPKQSQITHTMNTWKSTNIYQSDYGDDCLFDDERISFDVVDVKQYVSHNDLSLSIQVIQHCNYRSTGDQNDSNESVIAVVTMSVVRFFRNPYMKYEERVPLRSKKDNYNSKVRLEFLFEEARCGMMVFRLYEAIDLRLHKQSIHHDLYVQLSLGSSYIKRSNLIRNGRDNPYFNDEEIILWIDDVNWANDLQLMIYDDEINDSHQPIGYTVFSLLPYMNTRPNDAKKAVYDLYYLENESMMDSYHHEVMKGELHMKITFLPAGKLRLFIGKALGLRLPYEYQRDHTSEALNHIDPYVELQLSGQSSNTMKRTPIDKDGNADPTWDYELEFEIVDQYVMNIFVYHQPSIGNDILIGTADFSLLSTYRNGHIASWIALKQQRQSGGISEAGNIYIDFKFIGLPGIAYPQYQSKDIPSYDDTVRTIFLDNHELNQLNDNDRIIGKAIDTIPTTEDIDKTQSESQTKRISALDAVDIIDDNKQPQQEFTEEEIYQAFHFIDLNHNNYIGASEIRHILICMGELITDEEIDMMISMIDLDGDGQISYQEFRTLVLHPSPESVDLHKEIQKSIEYDLLQEKLNLKGNKITNNHLDLKTFQKQQEINLRELKKQKLINFIQENDINFIDLQKSYDKYLLLPKKNDKIMNNQRIDFNQFCYVLTIDPIYEYKQLYSLFDIEELSTIDYKEFLLSCMNFINVSNDVRIHFIFRLYDTKLTGMISINEINEILKGNHMISLNSVMKKSELVMKHMNSSMNGMITLNELIILSKKFPNVFFPSFMSSIDKDMKNQDVMDNTRR